MLTTVPSALPILTQSYVIGTLLFPFYMWESETQRFTSCQRHTTGKERMRVWTKAFWLQDPCPRQCTHCPWLNLKKGQKWEEGGLPQPASAPALLPNTFSILTQQSLQLPRREAPSSVRKGPEVAVANGQRVSQEGRKQMKFRIMQTGTPPQHHLVTVGKSRPRDILSQSFLSLYNNSLDTLKIPAHPTMLGSPCGKRLVGGWGLGQILCWGKSTP